MNCKALLKMSSNGQYWQNASIFLLQSQIFGHSYHDLVSKRLATQTPDLTGPFRPDDHAIWHIYVSFINCYYFIILFYLKIRHV